MKHNLTFNWTYDLPFAKNSRGVVSALFKGWQMNNITFVNSGAPFTAQISGYNRSGNLNTTNFSLNERPNLKPGRSNNPILGGPDRYWDVRSADRKSTRLNSSHQIISYAVFCLKKKKNNNMTMAAAEVMSPDALYWHLPLS